MTNKQFKNQVTASSFLEWYFSDSDTVESFRDRAVAMLLSEGSFNISARILFDECGYIPSFICENENGDNEYDPSEVLLVNDLQGEEVSNG